MWKKLCPAWLHSMRLSSQLSINIVENISHFKNKIIGDAIVTAHKQEQYNLYFTYYFPFIYFSWRFGLIMRQYECTREYNGSFGVDNYQTSYAIHTESQNLRKIVLLFSRRYDCQVCFYWLDPHSVNHAPGAPCVVPDNILPVYSWQLRRLRDARKVIVKNLFLSKMRGVRISPKGFYPLNLA